MAPVSDADQIAFLKCCLKHAGLTAAKIPMKEVVAELGLPSVGAAQKRWSRLMQALDETSKDSKLGKPSAANNDGADVKIKTKAKPKPKDPLKSKGKGAAAASKKRKIEQEDGDEDFKEEFEHDDEA